MTVDPYVSVVDYDREEMRTTPEVGDVDRFDPGDWTPEPERCRRLRVGDEWVDRCGEIAGHRFGQCRPNRWARMSRAEYDAMIAAAAADAPF